jgi:hypothetical protein
MGSCKVFCFFGQGSPQTVFLLIPASQVARIAGMSAWHLYLNVFNKKEITSASIMAFPQFVLNVKVIFVCLEYFTTVTIK